MAPYYNAYVRVGCLCNSFISSSPDPGSLFEHFKADHMTATDTTTEHFREVIYLRAYPLRYLHSNEDICQQDAISYDMII